MRSKFVLEADVDAAALSGRRGRARQRRRSKPRSNTSGRQAWPPRNSVSRAICAASFDEPLGVSIFSAAIISGSSRRRYSSLSRSSTSLQRPVLRANQQRQPASDNRRCAVCGTRLAASKIHQRQAAIAKAQNPAFAIGAVDEAEIGGREIRRRRRLHFR